jgi:hypothetical protein
VNARSEPAGKTRSLQPLLAACRNVSVRGREITRGMLYRKVVRGGTIYADLCGIRN